MILQLCKPAHFPHLPIVKKTTAVHDECPARSGSDSRRACRGAAPGRARPPNRAPHVWRSRPALRSRRSRQEANEKLSRCLGLALLFLLSVLVSMSTARQPALAKLAPAERGVVLEGGAEAFRAEPRVSSACSDSSSRAGRRSLPCDLRALGGKAPRGASPRSLGGGRASRAAPPRAKSWTPSAWRERRSPGSFGQQHTGSAGHRSAFGSWLRTGLALRSLLAQAPAAEFCAANPQIKNWQIRVFDSSDSLIFMGWDPPRLHMFFCSQDSQPCRFSA